MAMLVDTKTFMEEVMDSEKPVLVDFFADWCMPCRMLSPTIDQIANESDDLKVCKVNIDNDPELARQFQVMSIPTLVAIKNGKVINVASGVRSKQDILNMFN